MKRDVPPVSPGEILKDEYLGPLDMSASKLASLIDVPHNRVTEIIRGRRGVTADTALRFAKVFGTTPEFWLNLQCHYDLELAKERSREDVRRIKPVRSAA